MGDVPTLMFALAPAILAWVLMILFIINLVVLQKKNRKESKAFYWSKKLSQFFGLVGIFSIISIFLFGPIDYSAKYFLYVVSAWIAFNLILPGIILFFSEDVFSGMNKNIYFKIGGLAFLLMVLYIYFVGDDHETIGGIIIMGLTMIVVGAVTRISLAHAQTKRQRITIYILAPLAFMLLLILVLFVSISTGAIGFHM